MSGFIVGGVVPADSTAYIERPFEQACLSHLAAGDWVTLLGPRQHGKTSALVRLQQRLNDEGIDAALIDLQAFPDAKNADLDRFLSWFVAHTRQQLGLEARDFQPSGEAA